MGKQAHYPQVDSDWQQQHARLLCHSFERWTGQALVAGGITGQLFRQLFDAPCVIVSHNTQKDPVFNFGNRQALELFEFDWAGFTALPSRLSAEPVNREERQRLLTQVSENGFIDDYSGVRISASGKRFYIDQAIVWNLLDEDDVYRGQAATFDKWRFL